MLYVPIDDSACAVPAKLRHSWLDNQVLLLLRPSAGSRLTCQQLRHYVASWQLDLAELMRYSCAFPSVVDPGIFLAGFAAKRGATVSSSCVEWLSARFLVSFHEAMNESVEQFRGRLMTAALHLGEALEGLDQTIGPGAYLEELNLMGLESARTVYRAATAVHHLLGLAPRGVWLL